MRWINHFSFSAPLVHVNANNDRATLNTLQFLIKAVEAQQGSQLTEAQAGQLIAAAQELQDLWSAP
ncbi:MAG: hypothetical protein GWO24_29765 [Akkermansiaceae bacterium]|nr:hypothetical protein [Akkermansiaceae bacterium]